LMPAVIKGKLYYRSSTCSAASAVTLAVAK